MLGSVHASPILLYGSLIGNLVLVLVAGFALVRGRMVPRWFWSLIVVTAVLVAAQVAAGVALILAGPRPARGLHLLYGALALAGALVQVGLRPGGRLRVRYAATLAAREARVLTLVCLTEFGLLGRAWMTGLGG